MRTCHPTLLTKNKMCHFSLKTRLQEKLSRIVEWSDLVNFLFRLNENNFLQADWPLIFNSVV